MMKILPLITASLVLATLYALVMERDALRALAGAPPAEAQTTQAEEPVAALSVVTQVIEERDVDSAVILRGRTEAVRRVEVRSETSSLVISDPLERGARITAGDVLCELDPGTRRASLAEAQARLAEAEINFTTASRLSEDGFAAQTRVASADATRRGAMAAVEAAQAELARLVIRAPFDGLLEAPTAQRGSLLSAGGLCGTVIQMNPILLIGFASEAQVDRIEEGALAGARLLSGREVMGRVSFLSRSADPATRTFRVEISVDNADLSVREGLSADILIGATAVRGHLVPGSALTLDSNGALGLRVVDGERRTSFAPVSVLRDTPQGFWVQGLPRQAEVIVVGHEYVSDGVIVNTQRRNAER
jgi:multidrug efflux system membrane fusion protein